MYQGQALESQNVVAKPAPSPAYQRGFRIAYEDVAKQARGSLSEYLADARPHDALYERAVIAAEESWTLHDGTRHEPLGREWLGGYWAGLQAFRSDLINYEDDEDAEKRLVSAGVEM